MKAIKSDRKSPPLGVPHLSREDRRIGRLVLPPRAEIIVAKSQAKQALQLFRSTTKNDVPGRVLAFCRGPQLMSRLIDNPLTHHDDHMFLQLVQLGNPLFQAIQIERDFGDQDEIRLAVR